MEPKASVLPRLQVSLEACRACDKSSLSSPSPEKGARGAGLRCVSGLEGRTGSPSPQPFPALCVTAAPAKGPGTGGGGGAALGGGAGPRAGPSAVAGGAEPGRASCAPARGPAVSSGRSPEPAADPGKRRSQASAPARGLGCCWSRRCGREDARGVGSPSPSLRGALSVAPRLARQRAPGSPGGWAPGSARPPFPSGSRWAPRRAHTQGWRGHTEGLGRGGSSSRCAAWAGAAGGRGSGANPERPRHLQRPRARWRRRPGAQVLQSSSLRLCRRGHHHHPQGQRQLPGLAWQPPWASSALRWVGRGGAKRRCWVVGALMREEARLTRFEASRPTRAALSLLRASWPRGRRRGKGMSGLTPGEKVGFS